MKSVPQKNKSAKEKELKGMLNGERECMKESKLDKVTEKEKVTAGKSERKMDCRNRVQNERKSRRKLFTSPQ